MNINNIFIANSVTIDVYSFCEIAYNDNGTETAHLMIEDSVMSYRLIGQTSRLIAALAHAVDVVAAVADSAVHADPLAPLVLAKRSAHNWSCTEHD